MRHATEEDLDSIDDLLTSLRKIPGLRERKRGYFSRGARAFIHFHADATDFYADVKFGSTFERLKITNRTERVDLLDRIRKELARR